MNVKGNVFKYGDNVDTDVIIPARYLNTSVEKELAAHCMEDIDKTFITRVNQGDIMIGGWNFGCGSSREHAPIAIKASGIDLIIAKSFARIFYRNSINIGLPILESEECVNDAEEGDIIEADLSKGIIKNVTKGKEYSTTPFPEFIQEIINCGGLVGYAQKKL
ncbi:MAG: 3-isopropylmalate dehydratase small subunit [Clostridia bacterium]